MTASHPNPLTYPADDLAMHARATIWSLRASMAANALLFVAGLALVSFRGHATEDDVQTAYRLADWNTLAAELCALGLIVTGTLFLVWIYTARRNLDLVATRPLRNGRRWFLVSWFLPVGNAWFAYEVSYEVWRLSGVYAGDPPEKAAHGGVGWWWLAWTLYTSSYVALLKVSSTAGESPNGALLVPVSGALGVLSALLALRVVRRLTERQARVFARVAERAADPRQAQELRG